MKEILALGGGGLAAMGLIMEEALRLVGEPLVLVGIALGTMPLALLMVKAREKEVSRGGDTPLLFLAMRS